MSSPANKPNLFDPYGVVTSMNEWCCLLQAAQELRGIDEKQLR